MLKYIRNVRWQFGDIVPDYMLGKDAAALFISLRSAHGPRPYWGRSHIGRRSMSRGTMLACVGRAVNIKPGAWV